MPCGSKRRSPSAKTENVSASGSPAADALSIVTSPNMRVAAQDAYGLRARVARRADDVNPIHGRSILSKASSAAPPRGVVDPDVCFALTEACASSGRLERTEPRRPDGDAARSAVQTRCVRRLPLRATPRPAAACASRALTPQDQRVGDVGGQRESYCGTRLIAASLNRKSAKARENASERRQAPLRAG